MPSIAGAQDARLQKLLSDEFARASTGSLVQCDRDAAIVEALRGLPPDPTDADMATFEAAAQALMNAYGSRAMRLPRTTGQYVAVSPDGNRVLSGTAGFVMDGQDASPWSLFDPGTGALVADLLSFEETAARGVALSQPPVFSPDSSIVAIPVVKDGSIRLHAADDGRALRRLDGLGRPGESGALILSAGFNGDGSRYAAFGIPGMFVWDVATGEQVVRHEIPASRDTEIFPVGWDHLDRLLMSVRTGRRDDGGYDRHVIEAWDDQGGRSEELDVSATVEQAVGTISFTLAPDTPHIAMPSQMRFVVATLDGVQLGELPLGYGVLRFSPDGQGATIWNPDVDLTQIRRLSLQDGTEEPPRAHDAIPFLHFVCDMQGEGLGTGVNAFGNATYDGGDLPVGAALYDLVWSGLPQDVRDTVNADRVPAN